MDEGIQDRRPLTETSSVRLAVDIGGTFTDFVLLGAPAAPVVARKQLTTTDPLVAVEEGVFAILDEAGVAPGDLRESVVHATTLVTNALIEARGAPIAFVTTEGFEDVFTIRTEHRYDLYDIQIEFAPPPVDRERVFGVAERTLADGSVWAPAAEADMDRLAAAIRGTGAEAVAIGFLHSYANPENEQRVAAWLAKRLDLPIVTSNEVVGLVREYPRFVTTAANASTIPVLGPYLDSLQRMLAERKIPAGVLLMLSNGGAVAAAVAARLPVRAVESGPAAGALAGVHFAASHAPDQLLCFDMGGTTAKACLLRDGQAAIGNSFEYGRRYRFVAGSGLPLATAAVDLIEIGAGGGSIAHRDALGLLAVGPRSAGSQPGPACYGRGGGQPTVTDADLLLGYLDAERFAGGKMPLDRAAAEVAMLKLAGELAVDLEQLAIGIHELTNQNMAAATVRYAVEHGVELAGVPLLAFGGAGPVHACAVAELVGSEKVIFPPLASVLSAYGCLVSPLRIDVARTRLTALADFDSRIAEELCANMRDEGQQVLTQSGLAPELVRFEYAVDARYRGQANELSVQLGGGNRFPVTADELHSNFANSYAQMYGMAIDDVDVEIVTWRVTAYGPDREVPSPELNAAGRGEPARTRDVRFSLQGGWTEVPVYARADLGPDTAFPGPALVEERDTTIVLRPGWSVRVTDDGCLVATRPREES